MANYSDIKFSGTSAQTPSFRNIIINGDMSIAQRGTSFTGLGDTDSQYTLDRFKWTEEGATDTAEYTVSQSTDVPTGQGFSKSLKVDCTTADTSIDANNIQYIGTAIEGQNLQYLKYGTSNAKSTTLSFWVRSNKTGTYGVALISNDSTEYLYSQTYTINSADTWEKKTLTFEGDTTGSFDNDNAQSLQVNFWLGAGTSFTSGTLGTSWSANTNADRAVGQVNLADSTSNYINITGVQLEVGTSASDFEFLPYDVNFQRCQRYFESSCAPLQNPSDGISSVGIIDQAGAHPIYQPMIFNTSKRAVPTMTYYNGSSGSTGTWRTNAATDVSVSSYSIKIQGFTINCADLGAEGRSANGSWEADAEL